MNYPVTVNSGLNEFLKFLLLLFIYINFSNENFIKIFIIIIYLYKI
jgi:hypothetical protein